MSKISKTLEHAIRENPKKLYRVLIVTNRDDSLNELNIDNARQLMGNIISAELKGSSILYLAEHPFIDSVEPDEEMTIT